MIDKEMVAACEWIRSCELFDRAQPGAWRGRTWMPFDMVPSYRHAQAERIRVERKWRVTISRETERAVREMSDEEIEYVLSHPAALRQPERGE